MEWTARSAKSERFMGLFTRAVRHAVARTAPFCLGFPLVALPACTGMLDGTEPTAAGPNGSGANGGGSGKGGSANGAGGNAGPGENPDPGSPIQSAPTYRLTNQEYVNSVRQLLGVTVSTPLDPDGASAGYRAGLVAGDATVAAYHEAAMQAAAAVDLATLVPCDQAAITSTPAACAEKLVDALGPRAFRRPLDMDTRAGLVSLYTAVAAKFDYEAGIRALVEQIVQSPYFLYHLELEEQAKGAGAVKVSSYSMASRLSFLIWSSTPDDTSLGKAAAGELETAEQIELEARRLLSDVRAKDGLHNFYEQWLHADRLPPVKTGKYTGVYDEAMRQSILASFAAQVDDALWAPQNGVKALLNGTRAFVNEQTAPLFGVSGVTGADLQPVEVNPAERVGILAHPAIMGALATENGTHPIKRGVFVWDQLLCQELPNPPTDVPTFPGVPANASVRQAFETFTSDTKCQGCHVRINPVGFLFENYDTLGAYTQVDDNGQPVAAAGTIQGATDAKGEPEASVNVPTASAVELGNNLSGSEAVARCLVRQLYRYTVKRRETSGDEASIDTLAGVFAGAAQNLPELLVGIAKSEAFMNRWNQE
jgi:hypothetical protein